MNQGDLHLVAGRILADAGVARKDGSLLRAPVDVENIAEHLRGLRIVGAERKGALRLPAHRKGEIRMGARLIVVKQTLLDDEAKDAEFREVIAHEIAHDVLHAMLAAQRPLPFGPQAGKQVKAGRMPFTGAEAGRQEKEAIILGALLQAPYSELRRATKPAVEAYALDDWTRVTSSHAQAEAKAATRYREAAVKAVAERLTVSPNAAKIALDYWGAAVRPPQAWVKEVLEARNAGLR